MSKGQLLLRILVIVAVVEAAIMLVLDRLAHAFTMTPHEELFALATIDTFLLTAISVPLIYYFAVRPFEIERNRAEDRLAQEVKNLEEAQTIGRVGSWQFLDDQKTLRFSQVALNLLELDPDQDVWPYEDVIERIHDDDREFFEKVHSDILEKGDSFTVVYRLKRQNGGERWVRERGMLSCELNALYQGTLLDISEAKEAEEARKRFVSNITHELRTPLTAIKGSFGLLRSVEGGVLSTKATRIVEVGQGATERLLRLIDELLDLDKISAGKLELNLETLDISEVLHEAIEANRVFADTIGVRLEAMGMDIRAPVRADRDRIIQVITNLLSNAAKASGSGESVQLELERANELLCISISDHGPGIPAAIQTKLFQAFVQSSSSYRTKAASTGLGLSISKEIIEMHGGSIGFDSIEGQGARFFFTLPIAA